MRVSNAKSAVIEPLAIRIESYRPASIRIDKNQSRPASIRLDNSRAVMAATLFCAVSVCAAERSPNIVFILADDVGYGDISCYGAEKVRTPCIDSLAKDGRRFTDAHSTAASCTATRYSLMTGKYAFRIPGLDILRGIDGLIIQPDQMTLPSMLKQAGYTTGLVGKWHLGLGTTPTDFNRPLKPGPLEVGFDWAWFFPATGDRTPCVWIENHSVVNLDPADPIRLDYSVARGHPESFVNGIPRIGKQTGGAAALWKDDEMSLVIAQKGCEFIEKNKDTPFFLYLATHSIHVPRVPNARFRGASDCGVRGDAIVETDWTVGQLMQTLDRLGLADDTIVIFTSDNGGMNDTNGPDKVNGIGDPDATNGHPPNGVLRGTKGTLYEGGHRVPFILRWPKRVKAATESDALICHMDMFASFAALTAQTLPDNAAPDSLNVLPDLLGENTDGTVYRDHLVLQTWGSWPLGVRAGNWKYVLNRIDPEKLAEVNVLTDRELLDYAREQTLFKTEVFETWAAPDLLDLVKGAAVLSAELYDLSTDLSETKNLIQEKSEIATALRIKMEQVRKAPRTRVP